MKGGDSMLVSLFNLSDVKCAFSPVPRAIGLHPSHIFAECLISTLNIHKRWAPGSRNISGAHPMSSGRWRRCGSAVDEESRWGGLQDTRIAWLRCHDEVILTPTHSKLLIPKPSQKIMRNQSPSLSKNRDSFSRDLQPVFASLHRHEGPPQLLRLSQVRSWDRQATICPLDLRHVRPHYRPSPHDHSHLRRLV